jgi:RNA polymerase sigma factor (sigma-70 family)
MGAWGMDYLDLFQEAMIGLGCAIDKFDLEDPKRVRFITYAVWWIRQAMMIASQDQAGIIRVPVNRHTQMNKIRKLVNSGKDVDVYDVAKMFRVTESVARGMLEQSATPMSLNVITKKSREDDETEIGDLLESPFFDSVADDDEAQWAVDLIENDHKMTPREKYVVVQRYFYGRTLDDIALEYGITRERIRQVQNEAMVRVKRIAKDYDKRCGFTQNDRRQMLSMGG